MLQIDQQDIIFYKKRIFQMAKDILLQNQTDSKVKHAFDSFCKVCIEYFKFIDKSDIIQTDYSHIKVKKDLSKENIDLHTTNKIIMRKKKYIRQKLQIILKLRLKEKITRRKPLFQKSVFLI